MTHSGAWVRLEQLKHGGWDEDAASSNPSAFPSAPSLIMASCSPRIILQGRVSINPWSKRGTKQKPTRNVLGSIAEADNEAVLEADPGHQLIPILVVKNANDQVFGKVLTSEFVPEHINFPNFFVFFFFLLVQVSFPQRMAWKIFDHILRMIEESVLESQSNGVNFHHLFRHLRSFQKLCGNPNKQQTKTNKTFQALLSLFLSKALSPEMLPQGHIESIPGVRAWRESTGDTGKRALEVTQWKI